jgi:hypothetical protein
MYAVEDATESPQASSSLSLLLSPPPLLAGERTGLLGRLPDACDAAAARRICVARARRAARLARFECSSPSCFSTRFRSG